MFPEVVAEILEHHRVTVWEAAATRLRHLVEGGHLGTRDLSAVRLVMFYGEPMPVKSLRAAMGFFPEARFQNTYAASEAFTITTFVVPRPLPPETESLPIGRPGKDYKLALLGEQGEEVTSGELGEICVIGSVSLAGYWKDPELTEASRVNGIPNSFRTGDLARLGPDGNYHIAGRRDYQVKIRGHRFELGEIEAVLKFHPAVREAVAFLVNEEVNVCVLADNHAGLAGEIGAICARKLPVFARPVRIDVLEKFPQLPSGKIDRVKLRESTQT